MRKHPSPSPLKQYLVLLEVFSALIAFTAASQATELSVAHDLQIELVPAEIYNFPLTLALKTGQQTITEKINVSGQETFFELSSADPPLKLTADPDDEIFRRLSHRKYRRPSMPLKAHRRW